MFHVVISSWDRWGLWISRLTYQKKKSEFLAIDVDPLLKFCYLIIYLEWLIIK